MELWTPRSNFLTLLFSTFLNNVSSAGPFAPTNLQIYTVPDPKLTLQEKPSITTTYGKITDDDDDRIGVFVGDLPAYSRTVVIITFDVQITDYIDGSSFIDDVAILVTQNIWPPAYDNTNPDPPIRFECYYDDNDDDDGLPWWGIALIVLLALIVLALLVALIVLLFGKKGSQVFHGAGPSHSRENYDG